MEVHVIKYQVIHSSNSTVQFVNTDEIKNDCGDPLGCERYCNDVKGYNCNWNDVREWKKQNYTCPNGYSVNESCSTGCLTNDFLKRCASAATTEGDQVSLYIP